MPPEARTSAVANREQFERAVPARHRVERASGAWRDRDARLEALDARAVPA